MKALRSLEVAKSGLEPEPWTDEELAEELEHPTDKRLFAVAEALRRGWPEEKFVVLAKWAPWFGRKRRNLVDLEAEVKASPTPETLRRAKVWGFGDEYLAALTGKTEGEIRALRGPGGV